MSPAQPQGPSRHTATVRVKQNKEVNKVVMEYFCRSKAFVRKENLLGDTERECLENGKKEECLNQWSDMCVTRQGQLERMADFQNLNWKQ